MKEMPAREALFALILGRDPKGHIDYEKKCDELRRYPEIKLRQWADLECSRYDQCFENPKMKWYAGEVDSNSLWNKLFPEWVIGKSLRDAAVSRKEDPRVRALLEKYELQSKPRIIALQEKGDDKPFILDGWHRAAAFALRKMKIPIYLGIESP